jgi:glycine betaine/proline transport system permease protein
MTKVELPLATPTILAGLNQTIMLSLSMVVIASMISVRGLGNEVLRAMGRLDAGKALVGGLGIVLLAIVLDRITQGLGRSGRDRAHRHWWQDGPVGLALRLFPKRG